MSGARYPWRWMDWSIGSIHSSKLSFAASTVWPSLELADHLTVARRWGKDVKAFCSRRRFRRADGALRTTSGEGKAADGSKLSDHRVQEAGLDGFWIHRALQNEGIESHVVDAASIATSRRRRR